SEQAARAADASPSVCIGLVLKSHVPRLREFDGLFHVDGQGLSINPQLRDVHERTAEMEQATRILRGEGVFPLWQDELYGARECFRSAPLFLFNRGVGTLLGVRQFATHLNGFVRCPSTQRVSHVWIAKRSANKSRWPGKLDTIVGGGLPSGVTALDNMIKESQEEAGLCPSYTAGRLVATGSIGYLLDERNGLQNNTMFIYDLDMTDGAQPATYDQEVEEFQLWPVDELLYSLKARPEDFKPDICIVLLDFFVRHGILTADNMDSYDAMQHELRKIASPYPA
ncbi:TPA: hypothetical protein N0F65_012520, partial [Lagenidium giganteum]